MDTLFQHILVPVDFTPKNEAALSAAEQLARQNAARLTLLHVIEFIDFPDDDEISEFYDKLRERSSTELEKLTRTLNPDVEVAAETIVSHRSRGIVTYAMENQIDLIVMSSHPIDLDRRAGWGTISYQVSALCQCPIMLVKQETEAIVDD